MKKIFEGYLLVSDMDGTLLNSNKKISDKNKKAIRYFVENGGMFTLATGRMVQSVENFIEELDIKMPVILHNGAKIYNFYTKEVLIEHYIEDERKEAIRKVKDSFPHIGIEIFCDEVVYIYQSCESTKRYDKYNYQVVYEVPDEIWEKKWTKVLLIGEERELDVFEEIYIEKYDSGNVFRSGENYLDVVANGISKGKALEELANKYNFNKEKIIAVGDNMNDIEMLALAKYGFFIKNGSSRALENARLLAPSKDDNPIEYIVNYLEEIVR